MIERNNLKNISQNQIYAMVFDQVSIGIEIYDQHGLLTDSNQACQDIFGVSDVNDIKSFNLFKDPNIDMEKRVALQKGLAVNYEAYFDFNMVKEYNLYPTTKSGKIFIKVIINPIKNPQTQELLGFIALIQDLTEKKQNETMLSIANTRWQYALEGAGDGLWDWNPQTNEVFFSLRWKSMLGFEDHEVGNSIEEWDKRIHPDDKASCYEDLNRHLKGLTEDYKNIHRVRCKNGTYKWILDRGKIIEKNSEGNPIRVIGTHTDITDRKVAEELLNKKTEELDNYFNHALDLFCIANHEGFFLKLNKEWEQTLGYSIQEMLGQKFLNFVHPDDLAVTMAAMSSLAAQKPLLNFTNRYRAKNGSYRYIEWRSKPSGDLIFAAARDVTERRLAEEANLIMEQQLQQIQKLESLGVLAGGIAHDFNNLMTGLFGYIDLAKTSAQDQQTVHYLNKAIGSIERARALTYQLLTFSKGGAPAKKIGYLFPLLQEVSQFALSGSNVSCHFQIDENLWVCNFDKNQLSQVIDNLIINAIQSMQAGGTIEMSAKNIVIKGTEKLTQGNYILISVKDQGEGIPQELVTKIFDPFFTTKEKGHGLGLSICYSIIKQHGGLIEAESTRGKGSVFKIYLPASPEKVLATAEEAIITKTGKGTILVMDDEESILNVSADMITAFGYSAITARDGQEALNIFSQQQQDNAISGVILDLTIAGGMGGLATVKALRKIAPKIPIFVSSGYTDDVVMSCPRDYGFTDSLQKPFTTQELIKLLDRYL